MSSPGSGEPADPASESLDPSDLEEISSGPPPFAGPPDRRSRPPAFSGKAPPPVPARPAIPPLPPLPPVPPITRPPIPLPNRAVRDSRSAAEPLKPTPPVGESAQSAADVSLKRPPTVPGSRWYPNAGDDLLTGARIYTPPGGVEVGTLTPNIAVDEALEAQLDHPSVVDNALTGLSDTAERRASELLRELEAVADADPVAAAGFAYELGELYERKLGDEANAVKSYGRALQLDPSLRANLWAIRRVFYRRQLWPNLIKLVDAELEFARDAVERADLLLEKARIAGHHMDDVGEARLALEEACRLAPTHQGVLLELERLLVTTSDQPALLEVWERLAEAADHPGRKVAYLLEVARAASLARDAERARRAFDRAAQVASAVPGAAVRVARERLRAVEESGTAPQVSSAIESLIAALTTAAGGRGPTGEMRRELAALRRRQAQVVRVESPETAWDLLQEARALAPTEPLLRLDLTELAEQLGRYDALADLVQASGEAEVDPQKALLLSVRRADALLRGGQRDEARELLSSLAAQAPGFIALSSAAERDALASHDVAELAATYLAAAQAASAGTWTGPHEEPIPDPAAAAALYVQAAELLAYELGASGDAQQPGAEVPPDVASRWPDPVAAARTALVNALEAVPNFPAAVEALIELEDSVGNTDEALRLLQEQVTRADPAEKPWVLERAIRVARCHGDLETVLALERQLYGMAPDALAPNPLRATAEPGFSVWHLESTLAQLGRDDERADLLMEIAARQADTASRCSVLLEAARLRERSGEVEAATELYGQVVAAQPHDAFARESLVDLLRAQERWVELVAQRRSEAGVAVDEARVRRAFREAAWVLEVKIGDLAQAASVYDEWLVRVADDPVALEGAARCRSALGDREGTAALYAKLAEVDSTPSTQWVYAQALERAMRFDDAAAVYRSLVRGSGGSAAGTTAALALGELATVRGDAALRTEALEALGARVADPRLKAQLLVGSGLGYAFALGDFDRAYAACDMAVAADEAGAYSNVGAALVAARSGNRPALARAYQRLAEVAAGHEIAAALWLRSASLAEAAGDIETAKRGVASALRAVPEDECVIAVAAETNTAPRVDALDPFAAIDPLLLRAEAFDRRAGLADDSSERAAWETDRAEALELAGRLRAAGTVLSGVLRVKPNDLRAWTALRRIAIRSGDISTLAHASYALACRLSNPHTQLDLLREAAAVFDGPDVARNNNYAVATYARIVRIEPGAPEFDRLLELLRLRGAPKPLVRIITNRLDWLRTDAGAAQGAEALIPLLLERAAVLASQGDREAAVVDLDNLLERVPEQEEALRFRADLAIEVGDSGTAIGLWQRYLAVELHRHRRTEIELRLAQLLVDTTDDIAGAIEQLERVVQANFDDVQAHERLFELCVRARDWQRAARELRQIIRLEPSPHEKARVEVRLSRLLREHVRDHSAARSALERARDLDPLNLEIVRELADLLEPSQRGSLLAGTAATLRAAVAKSPGTGELYQQLGLVSAWQNDTDSQWLALVGVEAVGTLGEVERNKIAVGRAELRAPARVSLDATARARLRGALGGGVVELWRLCAPAMRSAIGVEPSKSGFERGDRVASRKLGDAYPHVATAVAAFGIEEIDVYVSSSCPGVARSLPGDPPVLCLGADIAAAATPADRFYIGRAVASIAEGVALFEELDDSEIEWSLVAALTVVDARVPTSLVDRTRNYATAIADRAKVLKKQLSRKARAQLFELVSRADDLLENDRTPDITSVRREIFGFGCRAGLTWCGDLAVALEILDMGKQGRFLSEWPTVLELVAWSVSEDHLRLRESLAIALRAPQP